MIERGLNTLKIKKKCPRVGHRLEKLKGKSARAPPRWGRYVLKMNWKEQGSKIRKRTLHFRAKTSNLFVGYFRSLGPRLRLPYAITLFCHLALEGASNLTDVLASVYDCHKINYFNYTCILTVLCKT